jgi:LEA14-like dessication related protein
MQSEFQNPTVQLVGLRPVVSTSNSPRFEIDLRVINPNRKAIRLKGAAYSISLDSFELVQGVATDLPVVPAYGEAQFTVGATLSWLESFRLLTKLANERSDQVRYELKAKLDTGAFLPDINVNERGMLSLNSLKTVVAKP